MKNKKRNLLLTVVAGMIYLVFSSHSTGPGRVGYDCTGAESAGTGTLANPTGCSCHSGTALGTIMVALELDSAGIATTHYKPGMSYSIKITGTNSSGLSLPKYGFQIAALKDTVSTATEYDAGTFATTGLPTGTHIAPPIATYMQLTVAEHSMPLTLTGTSFSQSFTWTAPAASTGSISFWGVANFVTGLGGASPSDHWNTNNISIAEWPSTENVSKIMTEFAIKAYPNPVIERMTLQLANALPGTYKLQAYNINGAFATQNLLEVNETNQVISMDISSWVPGLYTLILEKDNNKKTLLVIKQ